MKRRFRIRKQAGAWRWTCTLCHPPAHGIRYGPDAWDRIVRISLRRHMRVRFSHHEWVRQNKGETV